MLTGRAPSPPAIAPSWCIRPGYTARPAPDVLATPSADGAGRYADAAAVARCLSGRLGLAHEIRVAADGSFRLFHRDRPKPVPVTGSMTRRLPPDLLRDAVVVCPGVLEALPDPGPVLETLRVWSAHVPVILFTTAERDRLRGWGDLGPPPDPALVREWTLHEFGQLLAHAGLRTECIGLTATGRQDMHRAATLAICTPPPPPHAPVPTSFRVLAIVPLDDAADVVAPAVTALLDQGVEVHVLDCGATDGGPDRLKALGGPGRVTVEEASAVLSSGGWAALLDRIDQIAASSGADWCVYHPVDERHSGPWPGLNLRESLFRVDRSGFDAVEHTILTFRLVDHLYREGEDFERHFRWFSFADPRIVGRRVTTWRNDGRRVGLADTAGRAAVFPARRILPYNFLLKQYPVRSVAQGERRERDGRLGRHPRESARGWPPQPDLRGPDHGLVWPRECLVEFDRTFWSRYLTERLWRVGPGVPPR